MKSTRPNPTPSWDLSDLFRSIDDPAIDECYTNQQQRSALFEKKYRNSIKERVERPRELLAAIKLYESILQESAKPQLYAELVFSVDSKRPEHGALLQQTRARTLALYQRLVFFELELITIDTPVFEVLIRHPILKPYQHYLERLLESKPHRLKEREEQLMNDKSLTGRSAFIRLFDQELANKTFTLTYKNTTKKLSEPQALDLLYSADRELRKSAARSITDGLKEESSRLSFIFNTLGEDKAVSDKYRNFASPEAERHLENDITQEMVDALVRAVGKHARLVHDFYRFKRRVLGLGVLYDYDRYAPIAEPKKKISFDDGRAIVLGAFNNFSKEYGAAAELFFRHGWIDAKSGIGKRGGAYCMYVTPDLHPYIFLNYESNIKSVLTLAHELGHGIHASLAREKSYLTFDSPLTLAETASVFGEMLVFHDLKNRLKTPEEKLTLYMQKIEEIFATVFRQIAMYRFEQDFHRARAAEGELSTARISATWRARQVEMFGDSVTLTADYDIWWSYVSHFIHTPFYVYAYAFGELLTLSIYDLYQKNGARTTAAYLDVLRAGGSASPTKLLAPLGIDLADPTFWEHGIGIIARLIDEAKALHASIKRPH